MAKHEDMAGDSFTVGKRESGIVTLYTYTDVWLTEDMVKDLIEDLADQINCYVELSPRSQY